MPGKDLGTKHTCFKCGAKFYDLRKPEPICPKCGVDQRHMPVIKPPSERRSRAPVREPVVEEAAVEDIAGADADADEETDLDEADEGEVDE